MRTKLLPLVMMLILGSCNENTNNQYNIIPSPVTLIPVNGTFALDKRCDIVVSTITEGTEKVSNYITNYLGAAGFSDIEVLEGSNPRRGDIYLLLEENSVQPRGSYSLNVTRKLITITANDESGLFYGFQTLRQLMPASVEKESDALKSILIPRCEISDSPSFVYRGMHLDVGRHMFPMEYIKRYIELMALHKMNAFHWHLTEDQGWRIAVEKYPLLTEVGSVRKETLIGHGGRPPFEFDGTSYGGFYTKDDVKEIVKFASDRFITVIPEIELPGHSLAALAAYPELACTDGPFEVATRWGVFEDVYCAGKEETFEFLENVLDEVIELFPANYIHIGGDECPKERWEDCPDCQARMQSEGLKDEHELQSYFIKRIESYLHSKGKSIIGWDEILEGGLAPNATVMSWRGTSGGIAAAKQGHDVIMTPNAYLYLDHYQMEPQNEPLAIGGYSPLEWVYSYNPIPEELNDEERKHILGLQGNLWSEYLSSPDHMEYMAYPRMFAIAETGWTPIMKKDFEEFLFRFMSQRDRYDAIGINYFKGDYRNSRGRR